MDRAQLLKNNHLFSSLTDRELSEILTLFIEEPFEKDDCLFAEGDAPDWLCIVAAGNIKMVKHSHSGREMIVAVMAAGDVIGEVAVFDGGPYPATAQAMNGGTVLKLARKDFVAIIRKYPSIALRIIADLGRKLRSVLNSTRELRDERVEKRIASALLKLSGKIGAKVEGGVVLTVPITRQDVADMVGSTIETTIRVISRFKKEGIVKDVKGKMLLDTGRLASIVKND